MNLAILEEDVGKQGCIEVVVFFFGCPFSCLLRYESKCSYVLAVYILRGYSGWINENPLSKKNHFYNPNKFARPVLEVGLFIFVLFSRSVVFTWLQTHVDLCSFLLTIIFLFDTIPYLRFSGKTATYRYSMYYY